MEYLSKADEIILLTIVNLKNNAYGVMIRRKIEEMTEKLYGYGTLYSALDQLQKKGYVIKITGEPTAERGGRRKNYYKLTKPGANALRSEKELRQTLWGGITDAALDNIEQA